MTVITTSLPVRQTVEALRGGAEGAIPRRYLVFGGKLTWGPYERPDGGVFASVNETPAWEGSLTFTPGNGHGGARIDLQVYDAGDHRVVQTSTAKALGHGGNARKLEDGAVAGVQAADPRAQVA